jgi:hypothetical protein
LDALAVTPSESLIHARRGLLPAPAGYGKTHTIAEAIFRSTGRRLILTHTNAGVEVLRGRLIAMSAPRERYRVSTIAGWALEYGRAFPNLVGDGRIDFTSIDWGRLYRGFAKALRTSSAVRYVVLSTYDGVLVDEYQDCMIDQHNLILALAEHLPVAVVGDGLQAIFGFRDETLPNWDKDVVPAFDPLPALDQPRRWTTKPGASKELGHWLQKVRETLEADRLVELSDLPSAVRWVRVPRDAGRSALVRSQECRRLLRSPQSESVVVIEQWHKGCVSLASKVPGYSVMEALEDRGLLKTIEQIAAANTRDRAEAALAFVSDCGTGITAQVRKSICSQSERPSQKAGKYRAQACAFSSIITAPSIATTVDAIGVFRNTTGFRLTRPEALTTVLRSLDLIASGKSVAEAFETVCARTRKAGRRSGTRVIGRTLLIKGLEFDHVIIINADKLDRNNLYVALTRATRSVTILSHDPFLDPHSLRG